MQIFKFEKKKKIQSHFHVVDLTTWDELYIKFCQLTGLRFFAAAATLSSTDNRAF